jgi:hypothetical protein
MGRVHLDRGVIPEALDGRRAFDVRDHAEPLRE